MALGATGGTRRGSSAEYQSAGAGGRLSGDCSPVDYCFGFNRRGSSSIGKDPLSSNTTSWHQEFVAGLARDVAVM